MEKRILLHSFTRSGNNLVRAFLEVLTGFPTQGCPGAFKDRPILHNGLYNTYKLKKGSEDKPKEFIKSKILHYISKKYYIAYKSHFSREFYINKEEVYRKGAKPFVIFLFRRPTSALKSHFTRAFYSGVNTIEKAHTFFEEAISFYQESLSLTNELYSSGSEFTVLEFDSLMKDDCLSEWCKIYKLILKMDYITIPNIDSLDSLVKVSKIIARRSSPTSADFMKPLEVDFVKEVMLPFERRINDLDINYRKLVSKFPS